MAKRYNLGTVISFEFIRTIKKPSFWAATLAFPIFIVALFGIMIYSGKQASESQEKLAKETFSIIYKDDSGIISSDITSSLQATQVDDKQQAIDQVRQQKVDAFIYYPHNLAEQPVEVYGKDSGLFDNGKYDAVAKNILSLSARTKVGNEQVVKIVKGEISTNFTAYKEDGSVAAGWSAAVPPLIFLVLFYLLITMLGNNLLNSTIEEKENRVTEMILTTIHPSNLIIGKMIATFLAGIVQMIVIVTPVIILYLLSNDSGAQNISLPITGLLSGLIIEPVPMLIGLLLFIGGTLLFAGSLMTLGAIMPTAKEAGQWFGVVIILIIVPFYTISLILSNPDNITVEALTYFPYTAPVTAMLRNAFGSLDPAMAAIVISMLTVVGILVIRLAVHLFRFGAMQYNSILSIKSIFKR